jgi:hypothetical protein
VADDRTNLTYNKRKEGHQEQAAKSNTMRGKHYGNPDVEGQL